MGPRGRLGLCPSPLLLAGCPSCCRLAPPPLRSPAGCALCPAHHSPPAPHVGLAFSLALASFAWRMQLSVPPSAEAPRAPWEGGLSWVPVQLPRPPCP